MIKHYYDTNIFLHRCFLHVAPLTTPRFFAVHLTLKRIGAVSHRPADLNHELEITDKVKWVSIWLLVLNLLNYSELFGIFCLNML